MCCCWPISSTTLCLFCQSYICVHWIRVTESTSCLDMRHNKQWSYLSVPAGLRSVSPTPTLSVDLSSDWPQHCITAQLHNQTNHKYQGNTAPGIVLRALQSIVPHTLGDTVPRSVLQLFISESVPIISLRWQGVSRISWAKRQLMDNWHKLYIKLWLDKGGDVSISVLFTRCLV